MWGQDRARPRTRAALGRLAAVGSALLTVGVALVVVGPEAVGTALTTARPAGVWLTLVAAVTGLAAWALVFRTALVAVGWPIGYELAGRLFLAVSFLGSVTPFGAAAGAPPAAAIVARARRATAVRSASGSDHDMEDGSDGSTGGSGFEPALAAVTGLTTTTRVVALTVGLATAMVVGAGGTAGIGLLGVVLVAGLVIAGLGWRTRDRVAEAAVDGLVALVGPLDRLPRIDAPDRAAIAARMDRFRWALERLIADRRRVVALVALAALGHGAIAAALWAALGAVGAPVPYWVPVIALPVARFAAVAPLPGGSGGVPAALTALVATMAGVEAPAALAGALLYRLCAFWLPLPFGAAVTAAVLAGGGDDTTADSATVGPGLDGRRQTGTDDGESTGPSDRSDTPSRR